MPKREPESQSGAYVSYAYVACHSCGQLTRITVCYPLVQASSLSKARFCPLCGAEFNYADKASDANGSGFLLVAAALFNREPSREDVQIIESIYPIWDAYQHPTFKEFLRSLVKNATP